MASASGFGAPGGAALVGAARSCCCCSGKSRAYGEYSPATAHLKSLESFEAQEYGVGRTGDVARVASLAFVGLGLELGAVGSWELSEPWLRLVEVLGGWMRLSRLE